MKDSKEIKKEKKEEKNHFVLIAFIAIVLVILLFLFYKAKTTGKAYDAVELKSQVDQFLENLPFSSIVDNTKICIAIEISNNETAVFQAVKSGTYSVTQNYCMASTDSDITIRFLSYDKFLKYVDGTADFKSGLNIDYDFSPSVYVMPGGTINSNDEFKEKYYGAINYVLDREEIKTYGMGNLLYENLNEVQQNVLKEKLPAEQFQKIKGSSSSLELPLIGSTNQMMIVIVLVAIVAVLSVIIYTVSTMSKTKLPKEVIDYIRKLRQTGYSDETTKQVLLNAGWAQKDVERALKVK